MTLLEKLLDPNNDELIILKDNNNKDIRFEQIAMIVLEEEPYFILHALDKISGTDEELFVFKIVETDKKEQLLVLETNEEVVNEVLEGYNSLLLEE